MGGDYTFIDLTSNSEHKINPNKISILLPTEEENIYPKSEENIKALKIKYLDKFDSLDSSDIVATVNEHPMLSMNQIEFIVRKISEGYESIFEPNLHTKFRKSSNKKVMIHNLFSYAVNALELFEKKNLGSYNRIRITKEFREFILKTEKIIKFKPRMLNSRIKQKT